MMFKTTHLRGNTKPLSIQQSKIELKINDPTSFHHPRPHCTMGRSFARNPSLSGKKSTTLAARQSHSEKWHHHEAAPEEGRVGCWAKLPRSGKAMYLTHPPHKPTVLHQVQMVVASYLPLL
jgi:hypothetical protein